MLHRLVLSNGITLIVMENPTADLVAGRLFIKNMGLRWENREKAGLSHLLATVLTKGTEHRTSVEIADAVESMGANLGADATADYFMISLKTVSADFSSLFALVAEILQSPSFPETEVSLEKQLTQRTIRSQLEQPFNTAFYHLREAMYPHHPYGLSILGTEETVSQLTRADLQAYHHRHFRPDHLIISLSGRITLKDAIALVETHLGHWESSSHPLELTAFPPLIPQPTQSFTPQDTQQSIIMLGYLCDGVSSPDYSVLKLLNIYLGNGLSSRLFVELREKRGLAYDVSAFYPTRLDKSQFVVYMGTAPQNTPAAIAGLRGEVERLVEQELPEEELQAAKNKLLGQYALGKQTNAEIAQLYGWYEAIGLGIDFDDQFQEAITEVTSAMIHQTAQKYFIEPYISIVGPPQA